MATCHNCIERNGHLVKYSTHYEYGTGDHYTSRTVYQNGNTESSSSNTSCNCAGTSTMAVNGAASTIQRA